MVSTTSVLVAAIGAAAMGLFVMVPPALVFKARPFQAQGLLCGAASRFKARRGCPREVARFAGSPGRPKSRDTGGRSPWGILGIAPTSDRDAIKARFRELTRAHHPDLHGGLDSDGFFREVVEATSRVLKGAERARKGTVYANRSAAESVRQRRRKRQPEAAADELIYFGRSRMRRARWCYYYITEGNIEMFWPGRGITEYVPGTGKVILWKDIRHIIGRLDLQDDMCDLEFELYTGSRFTVEQLPLAVARRIESMVQMHYAEYLLRRALMLHRCPRVRYQKKKKWTRWYR